jgi:hypothetical protein
VRYLGTMTGLLEKALRRMEALSEEEQNAIATQILESLDDEDTWARKLREQPDLCVPSLAKPSRNIGVEIPAPLMKPPDEIVDNPAISHSLRRSS